MNASSQSEHSFLNRTAALGVHPFSHRRIPRTRETLPMWTLVAGSGSFEGLVPNGWGCWTCPLPPPPLCGGLVGIFWPSRRGRLWGPKNSRTNVHARRCTNIHVKQCTNIHVKRCTNICLRRCTNSCTNSCTNFVTNILCLEMARFKT